MINHEELLKKYIRLVGDCEGINCIGHARREFLYGILESFISKNDKKFSIATPNIAIAAANIHDLNLERSPILTQSDTAPIVQKLVFVTTKPRIKPSTPT